MNTTNAISFDLAYYADIPEGKQPNASSTATTPKNKNSKKFVSFAFACQLLVLKIRPLGGAVGNRYPGKRVIMGEMFWFRTAKSSK